MLEALHRDVLEDQAQLALDSQRIKALEEENEKLKSENGRLRDEVFTNKSQFSPICSNIDHSQDAIPTVCHTKFNRNSLQIGRRTLRTEESRVAYATADPNTRLSFDRAIKSAEIGCSSDAKSKRGPERATSTCVKPFKANLTEQEVRPFILTCTEGVEEEGECRVPTGETQPHNRAVKRGLPCQGEIIEPETCRSGSRGKQKRDFTACILSWGRA